MQKVEAKVHSPPPVGCLHLSAVPQADPICSWGQQGGSHSRRDQEWGQAPNTVWEGRCLCQEAEAGGGQSILQTVNGRERREARGLWNHPEDKLVAAPGCSSLRGGPGTAGTSRGQASAAHRRQPRSPPAARSRCRFPGGWIGGAGCQPRAEPQGLLSLLCVPLSPPQQPLAKREACLARGEQGLDAHAGQER